MPNTKPTLTAALQTQITSTIRSGAYPHVAALAWGVLPKQLVEWTKRGQQKRARQPYRAFAEEINVALAQSRAKAEMELFQNAPKYWLFHGPGRDKPHSPGWGPMPRNRDTAEFDDRKSTLLQPQILRFFTWLRNELVDFPKARYHLSAKIAAHPFDFEEPAQSVCDVSPL